MYMRMYICVHTYVCLRTVAAGDAVQSTRACPVIHGTGSLGCTTQEPMQSWAKGVPNGLRGIVFLKWPLRRPCMAGVGTVD